MRHSRIRETIINNSWMTVIAQQMLIRTFGAVLQFCFFLLLARAVGTEGFGVFSLSYSMLLMGAAASRWGMDQLALRELSVIRDSKNFRDQEIVFWSGMLIVTCVSVLVAILTISGLHIVGPFQASASVYGGVIGILTYAITPQAIIQYTGECFRAKGMQVRATLIQTVATPGMMTVVVAITFFEQKDIYWIASWFVKASWILCAISLVAWIYDEKGKEITDVKLKFNELKAMVLRGRSIALAGVMTMWLGFSEVMFLGVIAAQEDVAIYSASMRLMFLFGFVVLIINNILSPKIAVAYESKDFNEISRLLKIGSGTGAAIGLPVFLIAIIFPEYVLTLFGESYRSGATSLRIIAIGQLALCISGVFGMVLLMTGNQRSYRLIVTIGVVSNLFVSPTLISVFGINGAATSATLSILLLNTLFLLKVLRVCKSKQFSWSM